jgi:hypothetical protein
MDRPIRAVLPAGRELEMRIPTADGLGGRAHGRRGAARSWNYLCDIRRGRQVLARWNYLCDIRRSTARRAGLSCTHGPRRRVHMPWPTYVRDRRPGVQSTAGLQGLDARSTAQ